MKKNDPSTILTQASRLALGTLLASQLVIGSAYADSHSSAGRERVQREQMVNQAREAYWQGVEFERSGELPDAGSYYRLALDTVPQAARTDQERAVYAEAFANVCMKLAEQRAGEGGLAEANRYMDVALEYAPKHKGAIVLKERLGDPDWYAPGNTRGHRAKVDRVTRNLKRGDAALGLGEIDAAESSFFEVLHDDEFNAAARQGLARVERARSQYLKSAHDHTRSELLDQVAQKWETAVPDKTRLSDSPSGEFSSVGDSREDIRRKLETIIVPQIKLGPVNVRTAIDYLQLKSTDLDPEATGIKFVIDEQSIAAADANALNQQFSVQMNGAPLVEVLGYICEFAGLRYNVERYAVKIIPTADSSSEQFYTKTYQVPPSFEKEQVSEEAGATEDDPFGGGESATVARATPEEILQSRGIPWPDRASAFYSRGSSTLTVTNTQSNMELVDAFVESIQEDIPKQVEIDVKFVEIRQDNIEELGFDWLLGGFGIGSSDRMIAGGGTVGNSRGNFTTSQGGAFNTGQLPFFEAGVDVDGNPVTSPTGLNPVTAGLRTGAQAIQGSAIDSLIADLPRGQAEALSPAPGILSLAGILTDPQFQVVMRGLSQKKSADLVTSPKVVTRSSRKAKVEVIRELIYPVEFDPPELPQEVTVLPGGGGVFPVTPSHPTTFEKRDTGVTLEVDPQVGPDSYTITLSLAPEVVEFDGFVNYGSEISAAGTDALGNPTQITVTDNRIDLPIFSTRRAKTNVTIYDGATVALGGLIREDVQEVHDKVPIVGDLPYVGRLFRSSSEQHLRRNLVIFVTTRLIDPSGEAFRKRLESTLESSPDSD